MENMKKIIEICDEICEKQGKQTIKQFLRKNSDDENIENISYC
jgi:hypothetical protein